MEEETQVADNSNIKTYKGSINYEIELKDGEYKITFDRSVEKELAAFMISREGVKFAKTNLLESVNQAKGKDLLMVKDRLGKVTSTEYILGMIVEQMINEIVIAELEPANEGEIAPIEADNSNENKQTI